MQMKVTHPTHATQPNSCKNAAPTTYRSLPTCLRRPCLRLLVCDSNTDVRDTLKELVLPLTGDLLPGTHWSSHYKFSLYCSGASHPLKQLGTSPGLTSHVQSGGLLILTLKLKRRTGVEGVQRKVFYLSPFWRSVIFQSSNLQYLERCCPGPWISPLPTRPKSDIFSDQSFRWKVLVNCLRKLAFLQPP